MPKPLDEHFKAMAAASPKRLDPTMLRPPPTRPLPWGGFIAVGLVVLAVAGGWYTYSHGLISAPRIDLGGGMAERNREVAEELDAELAGPFDSPVAPSLPEGAVDPGPRRSVDQSGAPAAVPPKSMDASRRQALIAKVAEVQRGVDHLRRQLAPHLADAAAIASQLADADRAHWPKPRGSRTYEGWLKKCWSDARAQSKGQLAFDLETKLTEYYSARKASEARLSHERDVIASLQGRIAIEVERKRQVEAELADLP